MICILYFVDFFQMFLDKDLQFGDWFEHLSGYAQYKERDHFFFLSYEDIKQDQKNVVTQLAKFLKISVSEDTIEEIMKRTQFKAMKENPATNLKGNPLLSQEEGAFIRKGKYQLTYTTTILVQWLADSPSF